jgi:Immunity protein 45
MRTKGPRIHGNTGWSRLTDFKEECIYRGTLLRLPGGYPYESFVDFMVIDLPGDMALLVASGYKAGLIRQILPDEALLSAPVYLLIWRWTARAARNWAISETL